MKYFFEFLKSRNFLIMFLVLCIVGGLFSIAEIGEFFDAISAPVMDSVKDFKN